MAFDFEANTNKPQHKDLYIRSVAFANDDAVVCVDFLDCSSEDWEWFLKWVCEQRLIAFNALYDHGLLYAKTGKLVEPHADLYVAFKSLGGKKDSKDALATHSLKAAQVRLLEWEDKGNDEIKDYMRSNDYTWADVKKFDSEILLRYNGYDADSTWSLYQLIRELVKEHWETWGQHFNEWHKEECVGAVMLWIEALHHGMPIDEEQLASHTAECEKSRDAHLIDFLNHEMLREGVDAYNKQVVDEIRKTEPTKYRKDGQITARWNKWLRKLEAAENINHFNTNSPKQLQWLLYGYAGITPPKENMSTDAESLNDIGEVGQLLLDHRKMVTELKFAKQLADSNKDGVFYPNVVYPGTDTGRVVSREEIN